MILSAKFELRINGYPSNLDRAKRICVGFSTRPEGWPWENIAHGDLGGAQASGGHAYLRPHQEGLPQTLRAGIIFRGIYSPSVEFYANKATKRWIKLCEQCI